MKRVSTILGIASLFFLVSLTSALADCGCTSDCGREGSARKARGEPYADMSRVNADAGWKKFAEDIKSSCGASPISGYRRMECQQQLYTCIKRRGCGTLVGRPGSSPHETGIALDYSNHGNIRSCMEKSRQKNIPGTKFGRPHPGQHIDNGGRRPGKPPPVKTADKAPAPSPRTPEEELAVPPRAREPEVKRYTEERRSPARQQRVRQHRERRGYTEPDWQEQLWTRMRQGG